MVLDTDKKKYGAAGRRKITKDLKRKRKYIETIFPVG